MSVHEDSSNDSTKQLDSEVEFPKRWFVIGKFGRPNGIKGLISVHSFTEPREKILDYQHWFVNIKHQWQPIKWHHERTSNKAILVKVENYVGREEVAKLTNCEIAIAKEDLPQLPPDEYYWHELINLTVINQQGIEMGKVIEIMPTGSNDVLVVKGEKRHLIPYLLGRSIIEVDLANHKIHVDWDVEL